VENHVVARGEVVPAASGHVTVTGG